ncbi:hypothetical protein J2Z29_002675 [Treponema pedis]
MIKKAEYTQPITASVLTPQKKPSKQTRKTSLPTGGTIRGLTSQKQRSCF